MIDNISELYTLSYSVSGRTYHYQTLEETITDNSMAVNSLISVDYALIGVFNTIEEAQEYKKEFEAEYKLLERSKIKRD